MGYRNVLCGVCLEDRGFGCRCGEGDYADGDSCEDQSSEYEMDVDESQVDNDFGDTGARRAVALELGLNFDTPNPFRRVTSRGTYNMQGQPMAPPNPFRFGSYESGAADAGNSNMAAFELAD